MTPKTDLQIHVAMAARDQNINSVLFRNAMGRKLGLNVTDGECLGYLGIKGTATPTELARYTGLTTGSTTAMLDRLENAGFIRRKPNPKDRRGLLIEIGEKWSKKAGPLVVGIQQAQKALIASYSDKELEIIADFLTQFTNNIKQQTKIIEENVTKMER